MSEIGYKALARNLVKVLNEHKNDYHFALTKSDVEMTEKVFIKLTDKCPPDLFKKLIVFLNNP